MVANRQQTTAMGNVSTQANPVKASTSQPPELNKLQEQPALPFQGAITGSEILLEALLKEGVDTIFGLPGGAVLPLYDHLPKYANLKHVLVRHEQGATHMAEGYAKATGKVGVVFVTSGPGATNTITGIADAYYDSVPIVVFSGNVASHLLGNDAFQEADIASMTRACTKHNVVVRDVNQLAQAVREAFYIANTGRPGPVLVDIPKDILTSKGQFNPDDNAMDLPGYQITESFTPADVERALKTISQAKKPVLLMGGGIITANASEALMNFAERLRLPVASSLMGLGGFQQQHPLYMGFCGMHGWVHTNLAIANADVLVVVGNRLGDRQTGKADRFARNAKIIHIDLDPSSLGKNVETFLPIQGEIQTVLNTFETVLNQADQDLLSALEISFSHRDEWWKMIDAFKQRQPEQNYYHPEVITPEYAIEQIFKHLPEDAIVTTEVGQHQMWAAQRFNLNTPRSWITSGGLGTMGFGFPAAIGAQQAFPNRTVIDIAGDGSFQMTLQELATAVDNKLPVKVAIINNAYLGMVRQWQDKLFTQESHSFMSSPDYVKLAEAYGAKGFTVKNTADLDSILQEAMAITDRPVIIDIQVQEKADVYPWVPAGASNEELWACETEANLACQKTPNPPLKPYANPQTLNTKKVNP